MRDKDKQRAFQRSWIAGRRGAFFADKVCVKCGANENLELDHINPAEKTSHAIWSWSAERRAAEIAKCQILCRDCHKQKTLTQDLPAMWGYEVGAHGLTRYKKDKCRCTICRAANAQRVYEQRARSKENVMF